MGKYKALSKLLGATSDLARQTDTLLKKVPTANLDSVRSLQGGLEPGIRRNLYPQEELSRFELNPEHTPRPLTKGSADQPIIYGADGRGLKPELYQDGLLQAKNAGIERGELVSTLRKTEAIDNIRANEDGIPRYVEPVPLENPDIAGRTKGGEGGKQGLTNTGRTKDEITNFRKQWAQQTIGPFKHHHILDIDFLGKALNRTDFREILAHLKKHFGIEGGDRGRNIIGMMDENKIDFLASGKDDIIKRWSEDPNKPDATAKTFKEATPEQQRIATDLTKSPKKGTAFGKPTDPASYGLPRGPENPDRGYQIAKYWPDGTTETPWGRKLEPGKKNRVTNADKLAAYNNRWKYQGLTQPNKWGKHTRKGVKFDPTKQILSRDHIEIVHGAYNSKSFKLKRNIERMIEDGSWRTIPPKEAADMIAQVYQVQRNIVLNTAKRRLRFIREYITKNVATEQARILKTDPYKLREWILKNKSRVGSLGIYKKEPPFHILSKDPGAITEELQVVFATQLEDMLDLDKFAESFTSQL